MGTDMHDPTVALITSTLISTFLHFYTLTMTAAAVSLANFTLARWRRLVAASWFRGFLIVCAATGWNRTWKWGRFLGCLRRARIAWIGRKALTLLVCSLESKSNSQTKFCTLYDYLVLTLQNPPGAHLLHTSHGWVFKEVVAWLRSKSCWPKIILLKQPENELLLRKCHHWRASLAVSVSNPPIHSVSITRLSWPRWTMASFWTECRLPLPFKLPFCLAARREWLEILTILGGFESTDNVQYVH